MQIKASLLFLIVIAGFSYSCSNKICPAFQSNFILDEETRMKHFSYFGEDTLPKYEKGFRKKKIGLGKAGIGDLLSYRRRNDKMKTLAMEIVYPQPIEPDSMLLAELDLMADTLSEDEIYRMRMRSFTKPYREDQFVYLKYFGDQLKKPTIKAQMSLENELLEEMMMDEGSEEDLDSLSPKERKRRLKQIKKKQKKADKKTRKALKKSGAGLTEEEEESLFEDDDFMTADGELQQAEQMKQIEKAKRKASKKDRKKKKSGEGETVQSKDEEKGPKPKRKKPKKKKGNQ